MATEPNETKHTHSHMKKLILILAVAFGLASGANAQEVVTVPSPGFGIVDHGTSADVASWEEACQITDAVESGTCTITVGYKSDYSPVRFIQDGKVLKTVDSLSGSVKVEGVKYKILPHGVMKYVIEVRNPRGVTYLVSREDSLASEDDEEEFLEVIDNQRTPTPTVDSVEVLPEEPKLPEPDFYLVSIEVEADKIPQNPDWVVSYTPDGRSFTKKVKGFVGVGIGRGNQKMMVGISADMTPYSVEPGERLYKGALIMPNGKKIKIKVRQQID
jgi:hypothetical protein